MRALWAIVFLLSSTVEAHVLVITHVRERPELLKIQAASLKQYLRDEFELIVFNDATDPQMEKEIDAYCHALQVRSLKAKLWENYDKTCSRCASSKQYSADVLGFSHDGVVVILAPYLALCRSFSFVEALQEKKVACVGRGLIYFSMKACPDPATICLGCGHLPHVPMEWLSVDAQQDVPVRPIP